MNRLFISVPNKLLALIIIILLLVTAGFSFISLTRLNQDFKSFQAETINNGQRQFELHHGILKTQLRVWLESFADLTELNKQQDFEVIAKELAAQKTSLELNYSVEDIWFFSPEGGVIYSSSASPNYLSGHFEQVYQTYEPVQQLVCNLYCQHLIALPLLNSRGQVAVVAMTASLIDMMYSINNTLKSEVSVVSFSGDKNEKVTSYELITSSNVDFINQVLSDTSMLTTILDVEKNGLLVNKANKSFLVNLLPLVQGENRNFYMVLIDDVTPIELEVQEYRQQFLISALIIFLGFLMMFYFIARPVTQRLMLLANALPLLANREFELFRQTKLTNNKLFDDELDALSDSAVELSYQLEQMDFEIEQKTKELENIAMFDILTGLPNRNMLNFQLRELTKQLDKMPSGIAVLFLDLDDFKKVNDSHGHGEGDKLLIEAAHRIRNSIDDRDLAFRFGGDEFVIVLTNIQSEKEAINTALEVLTQFKKPIKMESHIFFVSVSIGIAYSDSSSTKGDDLISYADIAMYEAKANGGAQFYIHHSEMYQKVTYRVMLETEVRQALAKQQFSLSLQPQIRAKDKKIQGFEALLRWHHPERGFVSPDDFIPILENSEHMIELGYWIIRHCFELVLLLDKLALEDVKIAINLTAGQFNDPNLPQYLIGLIDEFKIPASRFELELTEQTLVKDIDNTIEVMEMLKQIGFSFAIDDFGTGYSSLAYLKEMPVDVIKIDKSFVFGMLDNKADYQIIMSTIAMVKKLGLHVIAEGVETSAQLRELRDNECDLIQGYYFSKPIPESEFVEFVTSRTVNGFWKTQIKCAS